MRRNILFVLLMVSLVLTGADVYAMNKSELQGKVTGIKGNVITVTTAKGEKITAEVSSVEGIKIGDRAWCEDDCRKEMKIRDKGVNVRKTTKLQ